MRPQSPFTIYRELSSQSIEQPVDAKINIFNCINYFRPDMAESCKPNINLIPFYLLIFYCFAGVEKICYVTGWSQFRQGNGPFYIDFSDPSLCTHIVHTFSTISSQTFQLLHYDVNDEGKKEMSLILFLAFQLILHFNIFIIFIIFSCVLIATPIHIHTYFAPTPPFASALLKTTVNIWTSLHVPSFLSFTVTVLFN